MDKREPRQPDACCEEPDLSALEGVVAPEQRNDPRALCALLTHASPRVRIAAAIGLGTLGDRRYANDIAELLHDRCDRVIKEAERALACLWLRCAGCPAARSLLEGVGRAQRGDLDGALDAIDAAIEIRPDYAEAHNQRGIVLSLMDDPRRALEAYAGAIEIEPQHFWALAGAGNCHAALGDADAAIAMHRRALTVHPRFELSLEAMRQLSAGLAEISEAHR